MLVNAKHKSCPQQTYRNTNKWRVSGIKVAKLIRTVCQELHFFLLYLFFYVESTQTHLPIPHLFLFFSHCQVPLCLSPSYFSHRMTKAEMLPGFYSVTLVVLNWLKRWCIMRGGKKHGGTEVHTACGSRNQQLFVVDIFLYCFFLLHWNCGSFLFFHAFSFFLSQWSLSWLQSSWASQDFTLRCHTLEGECKWMWVRAHVGVCSMYPVVQQALVRKQSFDVGLSKRSTVRLPPLEKSSICFLPL